MLTGDKLARFGVEYLECHADLLTFATRVCLSRGWARRDQMPAGYEPMDLAQKAGERVLAEERHWPDTLSLFEVCCGAITSMVSHLSRGTLNREVGLALRRDDPDSVRDVPDTARNPEELLLDKDQSRLMYEQLMAECKDDPVVGQVVEAAYGGAIYPRQIAADTGLDRERVKVAIRRAARRGEEIAKGWTVRKPKAKPPASKPRPAKVDIEEDVES